MTAERDIDTAAAKLRQELAEHLVADGSLRSAGWRDAVEAVPRHQFVPHFYRETDDPGLTTWMPVTRALSGTTDWLQQAYANDTLITQFDGQEIDWANPKPIRNAQPTSSSTLPGLVIRMLEELDVHDSETVLEIGTGTGYSTALMCQRFGAKGVTSIETDPNVARRAREALTRCGHSPRLLVRDGLTGFAEGAPYDRLIATCGVRNVPPAWVKQVRPGGVILTTLRGWMRSLGLVKLTVAGDGKAHGRFVAAEPSFMVARQQEAPESLGMVPGPDDGAARTSKYGPSVLTDGGGTAFVAQLAAPNARFFSMPVEGGPVCTFMLDSVSNAFAVLAPGSEGGWNVRQGGPLRLWDDVESSLTTWRNAGSPEPSDFGVTVTPVGQAVWLGSPDGPQWTLTS